MKTRQIFTKWLRAFFILSVIASAILISFAIPEWIDQGNVGANIGTLTPTASIIPTATTTPTPFQPLSPTITSTPTPEPTPFDEYDYEGVNFGIVTELEIIEGIRFDAKDPRNITFLFQLVNGNKVDMTFLPIRYYDWMNSLDIHCPAGSYKGCVYAQGGSLTVGPHSGCYPKPLPAEGVRGVVEQVSECGYPSSFADKESLGGIEKLKNASVIIFQDETVVNGLSVVWVEYFSPDEVGEASKSYAPSDLAALIDPQNWQPSSNEEYIFIFISGRIKGVNPEFSADRWLIIVGPGT